MSYHSYADADAKYPFYAEQGSLYVKCEGLTPNGRLFLQFKRTEEQKIWVARYCNRIKHCRECPLWESLWKDWERKHPDGAE